MTRNVTVIRHNADLRRTLDKLEKLAERYRHAPVADQSGLWTNQSLSFTRAVGDMILLARVITECALLRDECRGAHYKPEFALPAPTAERPDERRQAENGAGVCGAERPLAQDDAGDVHAGWAADHV